MKVLRCNLWVLVLIMTALPALSGCGGAPDLMPTPNLYRDHQKDPFADVAEPLQNNKVEVLYLTDRRPENKSAEYREYGYKRSRSVAFGISHVEFGKDVSWEDLKKASRTGKRDVKLPVAVTRTEELGRFPPTPRTLVELPTPAEAATQPSTMPATIAVEIDTAKEAASALLARELAKTPVKDVYIFVHGYNNTFYDGVMTIAQLWHFMGRQGVPISYSWPAGSKGLLRGYTYDRESSEFTVFHLKEMLRFVAAHPDVQRIHVIAHSRGTDVAASALRELHLEIRGSGKSTRDELKLNTLILAAPDLDIDVVIQRLVTARIGRVPDRFALYVCAEDEALGISNWLFSGIQRLGKIRSNIFTPQELVALRNSKSVQIVDARVSNPGASGHSYFYSNPAVSSDLILLLRYGLAPGPDNGRPLRVARDGFWVIDDKYPDPARVARVKAATTQKVATTQEIR
jgi:esterase/lipase superfamily enzyme